MRYSDCTHDAILAIFRALGAARSSRLVSGGGNATANAGAMVGGYFGGHGAGGNKDRNIVVSALCCLTAPIFEFFEPVWMPIKKCCTEMAAKKETGVANSEQTQTKPSEDGLLELHAASCDDAPHDVTFFVRTCDAQAMHAFTALWETTLLPAAGCSPNGKKPTQLGALEDGVLLADTPEIDSHDGNFGAVRALTKYTTTVERFFMFLAVVGLCFNAGAISQVASVTSRCIVLVLEQDYDGAQEKSVDIAMWGGIFAAVQLVSYFILERMAEVSSAR